MKQSSPVHSRGFSLTALKERAVGYGFILPAVITLILLLLYPFGYGIYISFFKTNLINKWNFVGLENYADVLVDPEFLTSMRITVIFTVTQMFPAVMLFVPYYKLLTIYGLANTRAGIIIVHIASVIPFCSWMMYGFFNGIPRELDEAARIDGCGHLRTFLQVVAPLTLPGLISTTIYAFIQSWNEYMFSLLCITKESMKTLPVAIGQMAGYDKIMWNDLMAASLLSSLPVVILFLFLQKYFINSMMAGAVKG